MHMGGVDKHDMHMGGVDKHDMHMGGVDKHDNSWASLGVDGGTFPPHFLKGGGRSIICPPTF